MHVDVKEVTYKIKAFIQDYSERIDLAHNAVKIDDEYRIKTAMRNAKLLVLDEVDDEIDRIVEDYFNRYAEFVGQIQDCKKFIKKKGE
jgi:hypothetical protein